jgi:hypothetical protein
LMSTSVTRPVHSKPDSWPVWQRFRGQIGLPGTADIGATRASTSARRRWSLLLMRLERRYQALRLRRSALSTAWSELSPTSALALLPSQRSGSRLRKALAGARRLVACLRMRLPSTRMSPPCARPRGSALRPNHRRPTQPVVPSSRNVESIAERRRLRMLPSSSTCRPVGWLMRTAV